MELVVIEKNAYLRLKQQVEDYLHRLKPLKRNLDLLKRKNEWMPRKSVWF